MLISQVSSFKSQITLKMKKGQVTSRAIIATNYDSVANSLFVTFKNGAEYVYYKVPLETYIGMICCPASATFSGCICVMFIP